jgi:arylsulfatase A
LAGIEDEYGPDLFSDYLIDFMARHRHQPFFAYYPMALTHGPFNPTPLSDDRATADRLKDDPNYFKDMVAYLDRDMGKLLQALDRLGLADNTVVLFYADNGTPPEITSQMGPRAIPGGKCLTTEAGMHVPLLARWPGHTPAGKLCHDLIDSTDVLPTLMDIAGAPWFPGLPLNGCSFFLPNKGEKGRPQYALFAHFDPHPSCKADIKPTRLAWDHRSKLYLDGRLYD